MQDRCVLSLYLARMPGVTLVTSLVVEIGTQRGLEFYNIKVNVSHVLLLLLF